MTDVWYPGRPPLRSPEIIEGLTHYIGALQVCSHQCAPEYLEQIERIGAHIVDILEEESADCLGSDADINALLMLMPQATAATALCVKNDQWDDIEDIAGSVDAVRWSLMRKLEEIAEGGNHVRSSAPDLPGRPAPWTGGSEDPEQEVQALAPTLREFEAEEAVRSGDEEAAGVTTAADTLAPALETSPLPSPSSDE